MTGRRDNVEDLLTERLGELRAPGEADATERAVTLAAEAVREGESPLVGSVARGRIRLAASAIAVGATAVIALTPAGADVRDWIDRAVSEEPPAPRPAPPLGALPTSGSLLVQGERELWLVAAEGSARSLGKWTSGSLSPGGINVAVARGGRLAAISAAGEPAWSIGSQASGPPVRDPRWAPSGIRIAYRRGGELRVAIADGSGSAPLARGVTGVAPAWRPISDPADQDVLAFAKPDGVVVMDGATGKRLGQLPDPTVSGLEWIDQNRLMVVERRRIGVFTVDLEARRAFTPELEVPLPSDVTVHSASASPAGDRVAVIDGSTTATGPQSRLLVARIEPGERRVRAVFSGPGAFEGPVFSPDGQWIHLGWPDSGQWVFIRPEANRKLLRQVEVVANPAEALSATGSSVLPVGVEWCCR